MKCQIRLVDRNVYWPWMFTCEHTSVFVNGDEGKAIRVSSQKQAFLTRNSLPVCGVLSSPRLNPKVSELFHSFQRAIVSSGPLAKVEPWGNVSNCIKKTPKYIWKSKTALWRRVKALSFPATNSCYASWPFFRLAVCCSSDHFCNHGLRSGEGRWPTSRMIPVSFHCWHSFREGVTQTA